jgi:hypothetical protein
MRGIFHALSALAVVGGIVWGVLAFAQTPATPSITGFSPVGSLAWDGSTPIKFTVTTSPASPYAVVDGTSQQYFRMRLVCETNSPPTMGVGSENCSLSGGSWTCSLSNDCKMSFAGGAVGTGTVRAAVVATSVMLSKGISYDVKSSQSYQITQAPPPPPPPPPPPASSPPPPSGGSSGPPDVDPSNCWVKLGSNASLPVTPDPWLGSQPVDGAIKLFPGFITDAAAKWAKVGSVKVVRKVGSNPTSPTDGVVIANVTSNVEVTDSGLTNGVWYGHAMFSMSKDGASWNGTACLEKPGVVSQPPPPPPPQPPAISNIRVTDVDAQSATVSWVTDKSTSGFIDYGSTAMYGSTQYSSSGATSHQVILTDFAQKGVMTYHFRIRARDAGNLESVSADQVFQVPSLGAAAGATGASDGSDVAPSAPQMSIDEVMGGLQNLTSTTVRLLTPEERSALGFPFRASVQVKTITSARSGTRIIFNYTDVTEEDADFDGLPDDLEDDLGTDSDFEDTDGDGKSDGYEYHISKTDPTKAD